MDSVNYLDFKPEDITPQSFESNDGRFNIEMCDEDYFQITIHELSGDNEHFADEKFDFVQTLTLNGEDLDRLSELLKCVKQINPYSWDTVLKKQAAEISAEEIYNF